MSNFDHDADFLAHAAEMAAVANAATARLATVAAKARRAPDADGEEIPEIDFGGVNPRGYGSLGSSRPRNIPRHKPVMSSGRGAEQLSDESDWNYGDGSSRAATELGRQLAENKRTMRKLASEIQRIVDEEPEESEPNQHTWATASERVDLMNGTAMQRASIADLIHAVAGRGGKDLPHEKLAKAASIIGQRIEAASDELSMVEQIAAGSLLAMLDAAAEDPRIAEEFRERLAASGPGVQRVFGV